ncbi:MAG: DUF3576 domain-containing protein [Alphaproteobacteria bacterium]|nr:DUF3576 domain-containing protein [Alphaproteobacteria bacterium]
MSLRNLIILSLFPILLLAACGSMPEGEQKYPTSINKELNRDGDPYKKPPSLLGKDGWNVLGGNSNDKDGADGVRVNGFLWRAALDTVSFMPLASADPFGGVILTDWYVTPDNQSERTKLNVFILDRQLKSTGVSVKVFRQLKKGGNWVDAQVAPETATKLEDTILTRARQLRVAAEE